jgi:hypothetical protein
MGLRTQRTNESVVRSDIVALIRRLAEHAVPCELIYRRKTNKVMGSWRAGKGKLQDINCVPFF